MVKKNAKVALEEDVLDKLSKEELEALAQELESDESEDSSEEVVAEAEADGTGGVPENASKTNAMSIAMKKMAGMSNDQIAFFMKSLEQVGHEADPAPDASGSNAASIKMKGSPDSISNIQESLKSALKEDLKIVFGDSQELSEDFKEKMEVLFESSVNARVAAIEQELTEKFDTALQEEVENVAAGLVDQVDQYLSYVAEEWLSQNEVAIQKSLRTEIAEDFIHGMKNLFTEHYIDIPDEKLDLVDAMSTKVDELEASLNEQIEKNMELTETLKEHNRESLVSEMANGLTLSQTEKFKQLIETIDYDGDVENFKKKLEIVKENHFKPDSKKGKTSTNLIQEEVTYSSAEDGVPKKVSAVDPTMKNYVTAISRTIRH